MLYPFAGSQFRQLRVATEVLQQRAWPRPRGRCCSGETDAATGKCLGSCKTRFRVCLKHYQATIDTTSPCTYGDVMTPILGENSVNLTDAKRLENKDFTNPIQFSFQFSWPVSTLKFLNPSNPARFSS